MTQENRVHQTGSSGKIISDYISKIPETDCAQSTFLSLWKCLENFDCFGFAYQSLSNPGRMIKYGDRKNDRRANEPRKGEEDVFQELLHQFGSNDLTSLRVINANDNCGSYVISPVFGPYYQNAIFIVHSAHYPSELTENDLRLFGMALQKTHVAVAECEAKARWENVSFSARELDVLVLMTEGLSNKTIAAKLNISVHTVSGYIRRIMLKLRVGDRTSACLVGQSIPQVWNNARRRTSYVI